MATSLGAPGISALGSFKLKIPSLERREIAGGWMFTVKLSVLTQWYNYGYMDISIYTFFYNFHILFLQLGVKLPLNYKVIYILPSDFSGRRVVLKAPRIKSRRAEESLVILGIASRASCHLTGPKTTQLGGSLDFWVFRKIKVYM